MAASKARSLCVDALNSWERSHEFADDVLHSALAASRLHALDRAFVTELFYGVIRYRAKLDFVIGQLREGGVDPGTRQVLRIGLYQLMHMRVPEHAAVHETVELAGKARGLVNALLRRFLREVETIRRKVERAPLAIRQSHPEFLIKRWIDAFGPEKTEKLAEWNNTPASLHVRANTLKVTPGELVRSGSDVRHNAFHPAMVDVEQVPFSWIAKGLCYVQDPSTLVACDLLAPKPGQTVLDACAAPGGKTAYLSALMHNEGRIAACDSSAPRVQRLTENLMRLGVANAQPIQINWVEAKSPFPVETFDRILVDAPCSNTGVLRRRVDARWRLTPEDFTRMPARQMEILEKVLPLLKPGGSLVYSTCSLEAEENTTLAGKMAARHGELTLQRTIQTLPFEHSVDGAFAALFIKAK